MKCSECRLNEQAVRDLQTIGRLMDGVAELYCQYRCSLHDMCYGIATHNLCNEVEAYINAVAKGKQ